MAMPACDLCQGSEYYEEEGHFFCTVCHTQSQSMVVMEEDGAPVHMPPPGARREICKKKRNKRESEYMAGRPWTRYEAYQLIVQGQADALIANGAHPELKEAIQRLYFFYLSKLEVAFVGEGKKPHLIPKGLENTAYTGWHRELHRGGMDNPEIDLKEWKRKRRDANWISKMPKKRKADSAEDVAVALEGETLYEGDSPLEEDDGDEKGAEFDTQLLSFSEWDESSDEEDDDDDDTYMAGRKRGESSTAEGKSSKLGKQAVLKNIRFMNLQKTLSFLYVGCLFVSPWITVSDILKWVNNGTVPYLETTHLLQPDMKLSAFDLHLFRPSPVSPGGLLLNAGKLLHFLEIKELPPFPVKDIAIRYTHFSLDLPKALVPLVASTIRQCPVDCSFHGGNKSEDQAQALPNVDALCAAYILVALKAIFGLDDHREMVLTNYTKEVQKKVGGNIFLFNWLEWQTYATRKFLLNSPGVSGRQTWEGPVEALCQNFERAGYKEQQHSQHQTLTRKKNFKKVAFFKQENRELLKQPANILQEQWRNRDAIAAHIREQEAESRNTDSPGTAQEEQAARFCTSTVEHLIHAEDFLRSLLDQGNSSSTSASGEQPLSRSNGELPASRTSSSADSPEHNGSLSELVSSVVCDEQQKNRGEKRPRNCADSDSSSEEEEEKKKWETVEKRGKQKMRISAEGESPVCSPELSSSSCLKIDFSSSAACERKQSVRNKNGTRLLVERESPAEESEERTIKKRGEQRMNNSSERESWNEETFMEKKTMEYCEPVSEVWQLLEMYKQVTDDYWLCAQKQNRDPYSGQKDKRCHIPQYCCYRWLLRVLNALTRCSEHDIQTMVLKIEEQLLQQSKATEPSGATEQSK